MYGWIWRQLPGGTAIKLVCVLILATAALALLWFVIFPRIIPLIPLDRVMPNG